MAYGRDDSRRNMRDPRPRADENDRWQGRSGGRDSDERGFFDRAGDEIASWFGDDEAERRREMDDRSTGRERGGARFAGSPSDSYARGPERDFGRPMGIDDEPGQRSAKWREEGYRRPYTGRSMNRQDWTGGSSSSGGGYRPMTGDYGRSADREWEQERGSQPMSGAIGHAHDRHYGEWRQRQMEELDRDYDDYRREHQSKFDSHFSEWRQTRQAKRQMLGQVREHMPVVGSDGEPVGTVDKVRGDRIVLTKSDSDDGAHHAISCALVDRVEGGSLYLTDKAEDARTKFTSENRNRALFERDDEREEGPHMLNRSFSGTY